MFRNLLCHRQFGTFTLVNLMINNSDASSVSRTAAGNVHACAAPKKLGHLFAYTCTQPCPTEHMHAVFTSHYPTAL